MNLSRRRLLIAGRTGLLGVAGITFAAAARTLSGTPTSEAKPQRGKNKKAKKRKQKKQNKKGHRHQGKQKNRGKKKGNGKDISLRTGSVVPESLITEEGGRLSVHMLLPFEDFSSEQQLAAAVAEAEGMGLFVLPEGPDAAAATPAA